MKRLKVFLIGLLLVPASWTRSAEIHDRGACDSKSSCAKAAADDCGN